MKAYRGTFILLAVLVVLGIVAYVSELRDAPSQAQHQEAQVFALNEDNINSIQWRDGDKAVAISKDESGKWQVTTPVKGEADEWTLTNLLWQVASLNADRLVAEKPDDLATYGLDKPAMELQMGTSEGEHVVLYLGNENPLGTGFYGRKEGSESVYLINSSVVTDLRQLGNQPPTPTAAPSPETTPEATPEATPGLSVAPTPTP